MSEGFENYCDEEGISCEGNRGMESLEKVLHQIGYRSSQVNVKFGTIIETFLCDNPGAVEKVMEFIGENFADEFVDWEKEEYTGYAPE